MGRTITIKYDIGQIVFIKTDPEQYQYMITGFTFSPSGLEYRLSRGGSVSWAYDFEVSAEQDVLLKISSTHNG